MNKVLCCSIWPSYCFTSKENGGLLLLLVIYYIRLCQLHFIAESLQWKKLSSLLHNCLLMIICDLMLDGGINEI